MRAVTVAELNRIAQELGIDVIGAAPAAPYEETERHIRERRARGLFADMRFTVAQPEVSCHPESLLPGARTVVSAALCYYAPPAKPPVRASGPGGGGSGEPGGSPAGQGRLAHCTCDINEELRVRYDRLYVPRNDPPYLRRNALVALGNSGGPEHRSAAEAFLDDPDPLLREHAEWAVARLGERER